MIRDCALSRRISRTITLVAGNLDFSGISTYRGPGGGVTRWNSVSLFLDQVFKVVVRFDSMRASSLPCGIWVAYKPAGAEVQFWRLLCVLFA